MDLIDIFRRFVRCVGRHYDEKSDTAAHKARLPQKEPPVVLIAQADRLPKTRTTLVRACFFVSPRSLVAGPALHGDAFFIQSELEFGGR